MRQGENDICSAFVDARDAVWDWPVTLEWVAGAWSCVGGVVGRWFLRRGDAVPMMIEVMTGLMVLGGLGFVVGWHVRGRRAERERSMWNYALCANLIGIRGCLDRNDECVRDYLTAEARILYRSWHAGRRVNPPPFAPSSDELFGIADREFSSEFSKVGAAA